MKLQPSTLPKKLNSVTLKVNFPMISFSNQNFHGVLGNTDYNFISIARCDDPEDCVATENGAQWLPDTSYNQWGHFDGSSSVQFTIAQNSLSGDCYHHFNIEDGCAYVINMPASIATDTAATATPSTVRSTSAACGSLSYCSTSAASS